MHRHSLIIILKKLIKLIRITHVQLSKRKYPLIDIYRVFIAYGSRFEKIVCVFLGFGLGNVLLDVFVEADCLVEVDGFEVVEVDVLKDLVQFPLLLLR